MKLGKTARWILTIGILAILLVSVGVVYNRQKVENTQLKSDIAQAQQQLNYNTAQKRELETRLSQASSQLSSYQTNFQKPTECIEIEEALFDTADAANVHISSLSSSGPASGKVQGVNYKVFSLSLSVQGSNMAALLNFMSKLSETFPNSSISSVSISNSGRTLSLRMNVYAYG